MIHLEQRHLKNIQEILSQHPYRFYAFGSRVHGTHKPFSDLDICSLDDIPDRELAQLSAAFEESNLPFKVDMIVWNRISKEFQSVIKNDLTPLWEPGRA